MTDGPKNTIINAIGKEAALMQLAEEAAELSQAACKLARYLHGTNPVSPSLTEKNLIDNLVEELTDTCLTAAICDIYSDRELMNYKTQRWIDRINGDNSVTVDQTCYFTKPWWFSKIESTHV